MLVCPKCGSTFTRALEHCGLDGSRLVESAVDPLVGRTLERYAVVGLLGSGGMARVYRARHVYLRQDFAIKVLHGELAQDGDLARRFEREARALSRIRHPNVVQVSDFGISKERLLFMVMELVEGPTLYAAMRQVGPFEPARAGPIARQLALGLAAAHERGFVHRDLKPGNVMLTRDEAPKILDFGLVRIRSPEPDDPQLTHRGMVFGTPLYMAPEQVRGEDVGPAADLYALGVILYQLLTGNPPFSGSSRELAEQHLQRPPPPLRLPYGGLGELTLELLAKAPGDRPSSAEAVASRIEQLGLSPRPRGAVPSERPSSRSAPLSKPILDEERSHLLDLGATTPPGPAEEEVREALGSPWPKLAAGLAAFALGGLAFWAYESGALKQRWVRAKPAEVHAGADVAILGGELEPRPSGALAVDGGAAGARTGADPAPEPPRPQPAPANPSARAAAVALEVPARDAGAADRAASVVAEAPRDAGVAADAAALPRGAESAPAARSSAPPEPAAGRSFADLDQALGWARTEKGLSWNDVAALAPEPAKQWARLYRNPSETTGDAVAPTFEALMSAIQSATLDRGFLSEKVSRVKKALEAIPAGARDERWESLESRVREAGRAAAQDPLRRDPVALSSELTLLEADVAVQATKTKEAPARTRTSTTG